VNYWTKNESGITGFPSEDSDSSDIFLQYYFIIL